MNASLSSEIVHRALQARTLSDAEEVQALIARAVGARYQRPIGDRWNNEGHLTRPGNTDHKLLELVTNAQDAVLERMAVKRHGPVENVKYGTPHEAARVLLGDRSWTDAASLVDIQFAPAGGPPRSTGHLTAIVRDRGCGMSPTYVPQSIFYLGSRHKGKAHWQQGAYGLGGASTFRHAHAVVLVTRRDPDLLAPAEQDQIAVAVCLWEELEKGSCLYYLTTSDWSDGSNPTAEPWSASADCAPDFECGTHIALIEFEPKQIHLAAWGGEWSFERMLNTRLFNAVTPVRVDNRISAKAHPQNYRGLKRQFEENPRSDRKQLVDTLPFMLDGTTYHLPMTAYYFEAGPRADVGGKRNFVNPEHALMFTSNGQCHEHWDPRELRHLTDLKHIYDRLLVIVELDELPIKARTHLFPPERQGFIESDDTRRIKSEVVAILNDWDELVDFDREQLKKALAGDRTGRPTIDIARQIGRALKFRGGFTFRSSPNGPGTRRQRRKYAKADLYSDPTTLEGPGALSIEQGSTRFIRFHVNARDEFMTSRRGTLQVFTSHPDLGAKEITVGPLHDGLIRVAIAVPAAAELGSYILAASLKEWDRAGGGIGPDLEWTTRLTVTEPLPDEVKGRSERRNGNGDRVSGEGELIGVIWKSDDEVEDWHPGVPGHVDQVEAEILASENAEYKDLAKLGEVKIPTVFLNRNYAPLKKYEEARAKELTERGLDEARDRYAVGVGLGLLLLDRDLRQKANGTPVPPEIELAAKQAAAQSSLVMMPSYDRLAKEAGVEG